MVQVEAEGKVSTTDVIIIVLVVFVIVVDVVDDSEQKVKWQGIARRINGKGSKIQQ
jgi:hypothetical protein